MSDYEFKEAQALLESEPVRRMTVEDFNEFVAWSEGCQIKSMWEALSHWMLLKRPTISMN